MNPNRKKNIVISSLLKPVNDVRMYEKFALSIRKYTNFHVHIIGHSSAIPDAGDGISFYPLFDLKRLSWQRLFSPFKYYQKLLKLKPEVIINNSSDFQLVTLINKIIFGKKIYYDVRENYLYNIVYLNTYPKVISWPLGFWVRMKELLHTPFFSGFILAERTYFNELKFSNSKSSVIENKVNKVYTSDHLGKDPYHLLFSGTISESYGVFRAIEYIKSLYERDNRYKLTIIGYCALAKDYKRLINEITNFDYISLIGGDKLVPHDVIVGYLNRCSTVLMPYEVNKAFFNCIPTKLYEFFDGSTKIELIYNKKLCDYYSHSIKYMDQASNYNTILLIKYLLLKKIVK